MMPDWALLILVFIGYFVVVPPLAMLLGKLLAVRSDDYETEEAIREELQKWKPQP